MTTSSGDDGDDGGWGRAYSPPPALLSVTRERRRDRHQAQAEEPLPEPIFSTTPDPITHTLPAEEVDAVHTQQGDTDNAVPTWTGINRIADRSMFGARRSGRSAQSVNPFVNSVAVSNPRKWGKPETPSPPPPTTMSKLEIEKEKEAPETPAIVERDEEKDDGGWDTSTSTKRLRAWQRTLAADPPEPPPNAPRAPSPPETKSVSSEELPPRPNSARPDLPPVTQYYSEESDPTASPKISVKSFHTASLAREAPAPPPSQMKSHPEHAIDVSSLAPSPSLSYAAHLPAKPSVPPPPSISSVMQHDEPSRGSRGPPKKWWRQEMPPIVNPAFATRRLCVVFPFPLKTEALRNTMYEHFSKYGGIRCVIPWDVEKDQSEMAFVVYHDVESARRCLEDPENIHCIFRSASRTQMVPIDLAIRQVPSTGITQHVWIKLTGERYDARSRSASPRGWSPGDHEPEGSQEEDLRPLPQYFNTWAVPRGSRAGREYYNVVIMGPDHDIGGLTQLGRRETGRSPRMIKRIDLGRRVPDRQILYDLLDSWVEILGVRAPSKQTNGGWVFECYGRRDVEELLANLVPTPGITIRLATHAERSPSPPTSVYSAGYARSSSPVPSQAGLSARRTARAASVMSSPVAIAPESDRAVFVCRAKGGDESASDLLKRFERHGKIASVDFRPTPPPGMAPVSARILYEDVAAARRAVESEGDAAFFHSQVQSGVNSSIPSPSPVCAPLPLSPQHTAALWMPPGGGQLAIPPQVYFMAGGMTLPTALDASRGPVMWPVSFYPPGIMAYQPQALAVSQRNAVVETPASTAPPSPAHAPASRTSELRAPSTKSSVKSKPKDVPPFKTSTDAPAAAKVTPEHPRLIGHKFENGVFMPIYDPDELKHWREAHGIPENPNVKGATPENTEDKAAAPVAASPKDTQTLPLLPVTTGGHKTAVCIDAAPGGSISAFEPSRIVSPAPLTTDPRLNEAITQQTTEALRKSLGMANVVVPVPLPFMSAGAPVPAPPVPPPTRTGRDRQADRAREPRSRRGSQSDAREGWGDGVNGAGGVSVAEGASSGTERGIRERRDGRVSRESRQRRVDVRPDTRPDARADVHPDTRPRIPRVRAEAYDTWTPASLVPPSSRAAE